MRRTARCSARTAIGASRGTDRFALPAHFGGRKGDGDVSGLVEESGSAVGAIEHVVNEAAFDGAFSKIK